MKGIIINEGSPLLENKYVNACYIKNGHLQVQMTFGEEISYDLSGEKSKSTAACCNKDDTYDFETGALIALMKMCGLEKVVRACNEAFPKERYNTYIAKFEGELNELKKEYDKLGDRNKYLLEDINKKLGYLKEKDEEIKRLKEKNAELLGSNSCLRYISSCKESTIKSLEDTNDGLTKEIKELKGNIDELFESEQHSKSELGRLYFEKHRLEEQVEKLKLDCEKLQHGYNNMIFCGGRRNGKQYTFLVELFKKIDQKKVDAAYKEAYGNRVVWCSSQSSTRDMLDSLIDSCKYAILTDKDGGQIEKWTGISEFTWELKVPTKREHMWEKIFKLHKVNNVIIEVEKEDVSIFLQEIESRIPKITWASGDKIFKTKYTIIDIYGELKTHNRMYFRLSIDNRLSYSSDPNIYLYRDLEHVSYLPPMRWDLFKKGRLAVKVTHDIYKEFYEACEKELGKRPSTVYPGDYTVSICKKDGLFEIFTMEHQKETGKKIVDWEDVRDKTSTTEDPYDTWKW